jgi:hypothetical protein
LYHDIGAIFKERPLNGFSCESNRLHIKVVNKIEMVGMRREKHMNNEVSGKESGNHRNKTKEKREAEENEEEDNNYYNIV